MVRFSCAVMETGSDGWLTTRLISSLPAENQEQSLPFHRRWVGGGSAGSDVERNLPSLVCVSSAAALCSVVRSYSTVSPPSKDTTT